MKCLILVLLVAMLLVGMAGADEVTLFANYDGHVGESTDGSWAALRVDVGDSTSDVGTSNNCGYTLATTTNNVMSSHQRCVVTFAPNASMPTGSTVTGATLYFYGYSKSYALGAVNFSLIDYTGNSYPAIGDYDSTSFTKQANDISNASFTISAWNSFALTNFSRISTSGGNTSYMFTHSADADNLSLAWASAAISGFRTRSIENGNVEYMRVAYNPPDTTPPASITGLTNSTTTCEQLTFNWTNPVDADYSHLYVLKDNVWLGSNLSNTTTASIWTSLTGGQAYTFSSKTVDLTGNMNATWVNTTAAPDPCGYTPVTAFSAGNTTPCMGDIVTFTDESTNTPLTWYWEFGDGNTSTTQSPAFQYNIAGLFDVNLKANNTYGSDWENKTGYIAVTDCTPPPVSGIVASFTSNIICGKVPLAVQFNDTSQGTVTTWNWSFGDGNFSGLQNPIYQYNGTGLFGINFTANNTAGRGWSNITDYIRVVPAWYICPATPSPTPTWGPEIMPSTELDTHTWIDYVTSLWWLWILIIGLYLVMKR